MKFLLLIHRPCDHSLLYVVRCLAKETKRQIHRDTTFLIHYLSQMDNTSPFGEVSGLSVKGTVQRSEMKVILAVTLDTDDGLNSLHMKLAVDSPHSAVEWDGVGSLRYTARLASGNGVDVVLTYVHCAEDNTLSLAPVMHFNPHGWIKLNSDTVMQLDHSVYSYRIPHDIVEEHLLRHTASSLAKLVDIESVYGLTLADKRDPTRYSQLPFIAKRRRPAPSQAFLREFNKAGGGGDDNDDNGTSKIPRLEDYSTFVEEKVRREKEERALVENVLEPAWEEEVLQGIRAIFKNRRRVRELVRHWHAHPSMTGELPSRTFEQFITRLLGTSCRLEMTESFVCFFSDPALNVPRAWLTMSELVFVNKLFVARKDLFGSVKHGYADSYKLSHFRLNHLVKKAICTRFIVQQFCLDCIEYSLRMQEPILILTLIGAVGAAYVKNKRDPFLTRLVISVEKKTILEDVGQMGMFVAIGDSAPEYEFNTPRMRRRLQQQGEGNTGLPRIPSTPYRLIY